MPVTCPLTPADTPCKQGWEYGQDHLAFFSIKNVRIENCTIISKNVNRVLKTSAYFPTQNYEHPQNCTDGVIFRHNQIRAEAAYGKQFWDMYCGTVNVQIEDNDIELSGFTRFVEDKAYQKKYKGDDLLSSFIEIRNNRVVMSNGNLFQFKANAEVDHFVVSDNTFRLTGSNINSFSGFERSCVMQLQGYKSCIISKNTFVMEDESVGLPLANVNFDCLDTEVKDNTVTDAYRIYFSAANATGAEKQFARCNRFVYSGNTKHYSAAYGDKSKTELYLIQSTVDELILDIPGDPVSDENVVEFGTGSNVQGLSVSVSSPLRKNLFKVYNAKDTKVNVRKIPKGTVQKGSDWVVRQ